MIKLTERLNTESVIETMRYELEQVIMECVIEQKTLDITDARLVPATADVVMSHILSAGLNVVDHKNVLRQKSIKATSEIINLPISADEFPIMESHFIKEYLMQFSRDKVYKYVHTNYPSSQKELAMNCLMLVMTIRPEIKIDVTDSLNYFFLKVSDGVVGKRIKLMIESTNDFYFYDRYNFFVETITEKDMSKEFPFRGGKTTWDEVMKGYKVIPTYFGEEKITVNSPRGEVYLQLISSYKAYISKYFSNQDTNKKSLLDFIEEKSKNV